MTEKGRVFEALQEIQDRIYRELREDNRVHEKRSRLLETRERQQMLMSGALRRNLSGRESATISKSWKNKISEVEN